MSAALDVVVVSYNSASTLRDCVRPLAESDDTAVYVVDNASSDGSVSSIADLRVTVLAQPDNLGFAHGSNIGWRAGSAEHVLLLNPDARIAATDVARLVAALESDPRIGIAVPKIVDEAGRLEYSQRRFPRTASIYAQALFLHRVAPRAHWVDELVRDPAAYSAPGSPEWASGACMLVRRDLLVALDGLDEGFFLYCEDKDLCRRAREERYDVRFEPAAVCHHIGGVSAPRPGLLPVLAQSRVRYARKHHNRVAALVHQAGIALTALTHALAGRGGRAARRGHRAAAGVAMGRAALVRGVAAESR